MRHSAKLALGVAFGLSACSGEDDSGGAVGPASCTPGESKACACTSGAPGAQTCASTGTYSPCVCDGTDAGSDAGTPSLGVACTVTGGNYSPDCDPLYQAVYKAGLMNTGKGNPKPTCNKNALGESVCTFACDYLSGNCGTGNCAYYPIPGAEALCAALGGKCVNFTGGQDRACWPA